MGKIDVVCCPICKELDLNGKSISSKYSIVDLLSIACLAPKEINSYKEVVCPNCLEND